MDEPDNMEDLHYYTFRELGDGKIKAWVYKDECPECGEEYLEKPETEEGTPNTRASVYTCSNCGYEEEEEEHKHSLDLHGKYTCPHCGEDGASSTKYKRRTYYGNKAYVLRCEHCDGKLPLTKKMKEIDELKP